MHQLFSELPIHLLQILPEGAQPRVLVGMGFLLVIVISLGLWFARDVEGESLNYIVAGRMLPIPLVAATLMAQATESQTIVGGVDLAAEFGFYAGVVLPLGIALALFLTGMFFAKPLNRLDLLTLADFYGMKFDRGVEIIAGFALTFAFIVLLAGNIVAVGYLFEYFVGVSFRTGVFMMAVIMVVYAIGGGLMALSRVDIIQVTTAIAGVFVLLGFIWWEFGFTVPVAEGPLGYQQLTDPAQGAWINWATILALGLGDIVAIDFIERVFSAESPEAAQRACFGGCLGTVIVGIPYGIVGVSLPYIMQEIELDVTGEVALLYPLLGEATPWWVAAIVLAGIFAASLSTGTGAILAIASVYARNIFGIQVETGLETPPPELSEKWTVPDEKLDQFDFDVLLWATRVLFVIVALVGVYIALAIPATGALLVLAFDIMFATALVPLIAGVYWPRISNTPAAYAAIIIGGLSRIAFFVMIPVIFGEPHPYYIENDIFTVEHDGMVTIFAAIISLTAFMLVGYLTRNTHPPQYISRDPWPEEDR